MESLLARAHLIYSVAKMQLLTSIHNIEDFYQLIAIPLVGLAPIAIFVHTGRADLVGYAFVGIVTMTIGQMGLFTGSETIAADKRLHLVELIVGSPTSYFVLIVIRGLVFSALGSLSILIGWVFIRFFFHTPFIVYHPFVMYGAILLTVVAVGALSTVTAALFSLAKNVRTLQASINGPLYLISGVLVPVTYLPSWLQLFSPFAFFYWSASLIRDSLSPTQPDSILYRYTLIAISALVLFAIGYLLLHRMINILRREGTLGLVE